MTFIPGRALLLSAIVSVAGGCNTTPPRQDMQRPLNIVLIVADDLGINDVGYNGNQTVRTPNLDRLAVEGTVFHSAYASSPVCSTSRAGLLTGLQQQRFGMESNPSPRQLAIRTVMDEPGAKLVPERIGDPPHAERGLPPDAITLAERLSDAGYRTAHIGKWHLGSAPGFTPNDQGFDDFFGFLGGASMFAVRDNPDVIGAQLRWNGLDNFLWDRLQYNLQLNGTPQQERGYQTDVFAQAAADFIGTVGDAPFFLSIAFNAPHNPLQAPNSLVAVQAEHLEPHARVYYAMIESLDQAIGTVLDALKSAELNEQTLVIVTSDNGGAAYIRIDDVNAPFRGFKANFWEGGIRVPLVVRHPILGKTVPVQDQPVSLLDLAPTILRAALQPPVPMDGSPLFNNSKVEPRTLVWRNNSLSAVRHGDWKLIKDARREKSWLYDLGSDPAETRNLADDHIEKVHALTEIFAAETRNWPDEPAWAPTYLIPVYADPVHEPDNSDSEDWTHWPG